MEHSPLGLNKWLIAVWLIVNGDGRVTSAEIAKTLDITQKSAWHMAGRIRFALGHKGYKDFRKESGARPATETISSSGSF